MAELKTKVNDASVETFLAKLTDDQQRQDCHAIVELMKAATGCEPKMWGTNIIGFGHYHYVYESGREGDWFQAGFSPRKQNLTLYVMGGFPQHEALLQKLGKHKTGKACLYINRLKDIDRETLRKLIEQSVKHARKTSK